MITKNRQPDAPEHGGRTMDAADDQAEGEERARGSRSPRA